MGHGMFSYGFGGGFMMIAFWALLIIMAVMLFRLIAGPGGPSSGNPIAELSPEEIIKRRFAKGEINEREYDEMRKKL